MNTNINWQYMEQHPYFWQLNNSYKIKTAYANKYLWNINNINDILSEIDTTYFMYLKYLYNNNKEIKKSQIPSKLEFQKNRKSLFTNNFWIYYLNKILPIIQNEISIVKMDIAIETNHIKKYNKELQIQEQHMQNYLLLSNGNHKDHIKTVKAITEEQIVDIKNKKNIHKKNINDCNKALNNIQLTIKHIKKQQKILETNASLKCLIFLVSLICMIFFFIIVYKVSQIYSIDFKISNLNRLTINKSPSIQNMEKISILKDQQQNHIKTLTAASLGFFALSIANCALISWYYNTQHYLNRQRSYKEFNNSLYKLNQDDLLSSISNIPLYQSLEFKWQIPKESLPLQNDNDQQDKPPINFRQYIEKSKSREKSQSY